MACSLTSTLLRRVERMAGHTAVAQVLERAESPRSGDYLRDPTNWVSYEEAMALFAAGVEVTGDVDLPRLAGEDTVTQHAGSPVATVLRSLGSPEAILEQVMTAVTKFSLVTEMHPVEAGPGFALVHATSRPGFTRSRYICEWARGMMSQPTILFGMAPATVEETECAARGGSKCVYRISWDAAGAADAIDPEKHITALESQLGAMAERVETVLATTSDLIAEDDLDGVLARITERAAMTVRAPRYLLAVRPTEHGELKCHHRGLSEEEAASAVARLEDGVPPPGWLVADVRSNVRVYGRLVAMNDQSAGFFAHEQQLFGVYARFAATVLDRAGALAEARHRRAEAQAMLELSRDLAAAGDTHDVAQRIVAAVPRVVDCDRVGLFLWDDEAGELCAPAGSDERLLALRVRPSDTPALGALLDSVDPEPLFFDRTTEDPFLAGLLDEFGDSATLAMPIAARGEFFGLLSVAVADGPERLHPRPELLDRLASVVAQAATALQSGRLIDHMTHQALHDGLTGLPNRGLFGQRLEDAVTLAGAVSASSVALFYVDVDSFKAVNDAYGHAAGDALLCQVAGRLQGAVRGEDTVARLGGDEFAVLLSGCPNPAELVAVGSRLEAAFAEPFVIEGASMNVSASMGKAVWPADGQDMDHLVRAADADMYQVKRDRAAISLSLRS